MCTNWKRFTLKAIMLASLSLFLYGCSGSSTPVAPAQRTVKGVVSDNTGGQPFANATVTAYAVDASVAKTTLSADGQGKFVLKNAVGKVASTPLAASVQSDGQGNFSLKIPASYPGGIVLLATGTGLTPIRSVVPDVSQSQVVVISPATEMVYQYVLTNVGVSGFTPDNIQNNIKKAIFVLEPFFGPGFTQIPPPAVGAPPAPAQQQLLVMTMAINSLVANGTATIADLVASPPGGIIALGDPTLNYFADLSGELIAINADPVLISQGIIIPGAYTPPPSSPAVPEPSSSDLADTTPPSAPPNLAATATTGSVTLTWGAATDNVAVTEYYVYRNGVFIIAIPASMLTYEDKTVNSGTPYTYSVTARDKVGNISAASTVDVSTLPILIYTISGKITSNGSALPLVSVAISGASSDVVATDVNGNYTFIGKLAGSYTITPTLAGFAFTPVSRPVVVATANITGMDFTAVPLIPGNVIGSVTNPDGSVTTTTTYPNGSVTTATKYPNGTVTTTTTYPNGTVTASTTYPDGTVTTSITYPDGTVTTSTTYPSGIVNTTTTDPNGTVTTSITYTNGTVNASITYPNGTVTASTTYPSGTVTASTTNPNGTVTTSTTNPNGTVTTVTTDPNGTVTTTTTNPNGTITVVVL
jgi:antitoxin component YwqK of YwqJK toxin-antitoxin module